MPDAPDVSDVLRLAVEDLRPAPTVVDDARRGGRRRLAARRTGIVAATFAAAVTVAVMALQPPPVAQAPTGDPTVVEELPVNPPDVEDLPEEPTAAENPVRLMPDLRGLSHSEWEERVQELGLEGWFQLRQVASNEVPVDHVLSHDPGPGGPVSARSEWVMTLSSGGPAVPLTDVPPEAADLMRDRLLDGEEVLVVETDEGTAYKVDAVLVGPCAAVDLAYRTFLDPQYDSECY